MKSNWNRRCFAKGEYSRTLRLTSELVDLRVENVNPIRHKSAEQVQLPSRSHQCKKTGSLPFGQYFSLAAGKQASRRLTLKCEPDSAQKYRAGSTPKSSSSKRKRGHARCPLFLFVKGLRKGYKNISG